MVVSDPPVGAGLVAVSSCRECRGRHRSVLPNMAVHSCEGGGGGVKIS